MAPAPASAALVPRIESDFSPLRSKALRKRRIPRYGIALLEALQFSKREGKLLEQLDTSEWNQLLALSDTTQFTLLLGHLCREFLPDSVRARIDRNYIDNAHRFERLKAAAFEISDVLTERSIEFALLKGFAHSPGLSPDPLLRAQGDIDLWCLPDQVFEARDALSDLGYRPACKSKGRHLDPMIRETHWVWRGDYFAADLPMPVDLHYTLWDAEMECIPGPPEKEMWNRRVRVGMDGRFIPTLDPADALSFAALHVMMHLLHGDLRLQRVWELAYALDNHSHDEEFWSQWRSRHNAEARQLQLVPLLLADQWFGCGLPELIRKETEEISPDVALWVREYGLSPVEALFVPNKDELWLNLCFLRSFRDKARVFSRRLLPLGAAAMTASEDSSPASNVKRNTPLRTLLIQRAWYHARAIPATCFGGLKWWWLRQQLGSNFWTFLLASVLFDFGEFIFFLLYNLYLLDLGHTEKFLGQLSAAVTAGTCVAILPVAAVTRRLGMRNAIMVAILGTAMATTLRAALPWRPALLFTAFLNGAFMSFWAVCLPPVVAG
ncbi:MAG: nucleotidyltransferase family protein, partial [Acidobacteriaceae bacterium]|nr:nucleotidyltransferase family protein [Acidobacteriaceae bacterium]